MTWLRAFFVSVAFAGTTLVLAGCGDGTGPEPLPTINCTSQSVQNLAVGQYKIIDPNQSGSCVRVPAAGAGGAEYLYVALATEGMETFTGVEADYRLEGAAPAAAVASLRRGSRAGRGGPTAAEEFHANLRAQERALSQRSGGALFRAGRLQAATAAAPPAVGDQRIFNVCATARCLTFVKDTATVRHVGSKVVIYLDNNAPGGGYTDADLSRVGALFDNYLYPIDTTAFGRESDIDNNGLVIVLLSHRVNELSPNCRAEGSVILGYFYGLDLQPASDTLPSNSNRGEIFYSLVPDPNNPSCDISKAEASNSLPPVFIHEFQHMISYNQHVLIRGGISEDTWLNEGLSHFAEELGGRKVPDAQCAGSSCIDQFAFDNLNNAYEYLQGMDTTYLVAPSNSTGALGERGAGWLFVRWLADHFGTDADGKNLTRSLVATNRLGAANVAAVTGQQFSNLVSEWQLANYLESQTSFTGSSPRLKYESWNFAGVFASFHSENPGKYPDAYPLVPDSALNASYSRSGVLHAGSGKHVLIIQAPAAATTELTFTAGDGTSLPPANIAPRIALVRIR